MPRLIDATPLIDECDECMRIEWNKSVYTTWAEAEEDFMQRLLDAPTVDAVEVVHGRWEDMSSKYDKGMDLRCSVCGNRADKFVGGLEDWYCLWKPNYCPNCGAKMDGDTD